MCDPSTVINYMLVLQPQTSSAQNSSLPCSIRADSTVLLQAYDVGEACFSQRLKIAEACTSHRSIFHHARIHLRSTKSDLFSRFKSFTPLPAYSGAISFVIGTPGRFNIKAVHYLPPRQTLSPVRCFVVESLWM